MIKVPKKPRRKPLMKDDNTFILSESIGWIVDWKKPEIEICKDRGRDTIYVKLTFDVTKDPSIDWKKDLGEGKWYKHSNEETVLKHMSAGVTLVCLRVHYESYVNKRGRKRRTDTIPFRCEQRGYTNHFRDSIAFFMSGYGLTLSHCAAICHTTPAIIKEVNKARLLNLAGDMKPTHYSSYIAVDEFLIEHGHRYCTIVIDGKTGELLYLEKGKRKEQLMNFFSWVGEEFMSHVKAISMDMNTNYSAAVMELYPSIKIVYDTFHIVKLFNDKVIDATRRQEANKLKKTVEKLTKAGKREEAMLVEKERKLLFDSRFLLLSNERTLKAKDKLNKEINQKEGSKRRTDNEEARNALLASNKNLQNAVKAREELSDILALRDPEMMREKLDEWVKVYSSVGVTQLTRFTKTITERKDGIVARAEHNISNGKIEGVNSFIKALRRSAFGYQDFDYFTLLIWEQTHKSFIYGHYIPEEEKRPYSRKNPRNQKRLKQTVFKLPDAGNMEAV